MTTALEDQEVVDELSGVLSELAERFGLETALNLANEYGGAGTYIPESVTDNHPLAQVVGLEAARWLAATHGRTLLHVPMAARARRVVRDREIRSAYDDGEAPRAIARRMRMSERQVWRVLGS